MELYTSKGSRVIDSYAIRKLRTPSLVLMEHASRGVYEELGIRFWPFFDKDFVVLCGTGNNGGDGICLARMLGLEGAKVHLVFVEGLPRTKEAKTQLNIFKSTFPKLKLHIAPNNKELMKLVHKKSIVIDAVFGTGFTARRPLSKQLKSMFELCRRAAFKLSIDVPSGLDADTGEVCDGSFKADLCVSIAVPKVGLYTAPGALYSGQVTVKSLFSGMPSLSSKYELLTESAARSMISPLKRTLNSHKGRYGHLAVIAPEKGMEGAVAMSVLSALRCGTGLVSVIAVNESPESLRKRMPMLPAEAMIKTWEGISHTLKDFSAVLIGPGYGRKRVKDLAEIIRSSKVPMIVDADAINILASDKTLLRSISKRKDIVLTPHPGEMSRLCCMSSEQVQNKRLPVLEAFCKGRQFSVLLKGYRSLLYADKDRIFVNSTGGPALAKGGSGDVLSGIIASFVAQGLCVSDAAALGMFVHGACADLLAEEKGSSDISLLPTDIIKRLGETISWLIEL